MKIKNMMLKNFAKVSEISVSFDENITYLIGTNGAGKTTIGLNGIWFIFKGLAQKGDGLIAERFRFIGPHGKSAQGTLNIYDESNHIEVRITRKLLKNKTELKIEASDDRQLDQAWLDSIFNSFLIDPMGFSRLSGKEQALAFGADTASFDVKKKELEIERRDIGRDVKRLQGVVDSAGEPEKIEAVDVADLMAELTKRQDKNESNRIEKESLKVAESDIDIIIDELSGLEYQLKKIQEEIVDKKEIIKAAKTQFNIAKKKVDELKIADEQEINDQILNAQGINLKAADYQKFLENEKVLEDTKLDREDKNFQIVKVEKERNEYLKKLKLPWPNITITDEGEFRLNDKPFCSPYFSTGEILKFGARIGSKLKDGLKYVFFPSSNVMDDENRASLIKVLVDEGFQVVLEFISDKKIPKENCILLKELKVVDSYDTEKNQEELG